MFALYWYTSICYRVFPEDIGTTPAITGNVFQNACMAGWCHGGGDLMTSGLGGLVLYMPHSMGRPEHMLMN